MKIKIAERGFLYSREKGKRTQLIVYEVNLFWYIYARLYHTYDMGIYKVLSFLRLYDLLYNAPIPPFPWQKRKLGEHAPGKMFKLFVINQGLRCPLNTRRGFTRLYTFELEEDEDAGR